MCLYVELVKGYFVGKAHLKGIKLEKYVAENLTIHVCVGSCLLVRIPFVNIEIYIVRRRIV